MFFVIDSSLQSYKNIIINEKISVDAKTQLGKPLYFTLDELDHFEASDRERYNIIFDAALLNDVLVSISSKKGVLSNSVLTILNTKGASVSINSIEKVLLKEGISRHWLSIFKLNLHKKSQDELFTYAYYTYIPSLFHFTSSNEDDEKLLSTHISALIELYKLSSDYLRPCDNVLIHSDTTGIGRYTLVNTIKSGSVNNLEERTKDKERAQRVDLILSLENKFTNGDLEKFIEKMTSQLKADGRIIIKIELNSLKHSINDESHDLIIKNTLDVIEKKSLIVEKKFFYRSSRNKIATLKVLTENFHTDPHGSNDLSSFILIMTPNINFSPWKEIDQVEYGNNEYPFPEKAIYINFKEGFIRPSLFRQLVQIGQRIENDSLRRNYAYQLLETNREQTERLMLLTVIGYSYGASSPPESWFKAVESILKNSYAQPEGFSLRWLVSLEYLIAISHIKNYRRESAKFYFNRLVKRDALRFCPVLALKTTQATLHLFNIAIQETDIDSALSYINKGKKLASEAVQATLRHVNMGVDSFAPFLWPETADLLDVADTLNRYELTLNSHKDLSIKIEEIRRLEGIRRFGLLEKKNILHQGIPSDNSLPLDSTDNVIARALVNEFFKKVEQKGWKKIAIWGTSELGISIGKFANERGIKVIAFIDSNEKNHGKNILGATVIPFEDLNYNRPDGVVITSIASGELIRNNISKFIDCILLSIK